MKIATSDKDRYVGDPAFVDVPIDRLTSKDYAATHADAIGRGEKAHVERFDPTDEPRDTTHISVIDGDGNPCSGVNDGIYLLNHLFRGGSPPPAPFPECGTAEGDVDCATPPAGCQ